MHPICGTGPALTLKLFLVRMSLSRRSIFLERRSSIRLPEAFPSEPVWQSRELRHKTKPSNGIEWGFELEKERATWRPVKAVVSRRSPEVDLFPEDALGKIVEPILVSNGYIAMHGEIVMARLSRTHPRGLSERSAQTLSGTGTESCHLTVIGFSPFHDWKRTSPQ